MPAAVIQASFVQAYVIAFMYFERDENVDPVVFASVMFGLCSFCFGIATAYLCGEKLLKRLAVTVFYIMPFAVARFSMHVALFVELKGLAVLPVAVFILLRVLLTLYRYYTYCTEHLRYTLCQAGIHLPSICTHLTVAVPGAAAHLHLWRGRHLPDLLLSPRH